MNNIYKELDPTIKEIIATLEFPIDAHLQLTDVQAFDTHRKEVIISAMIDMHRSLEKAIEVYNVRGIESGQIQQIITCLNNLVRMLKEELTVEDKSLMTIQQIIIELNKIKLTLNALSWDKEVEIIGKGLETTVKQIPMFVYADKVAKRLFETKNDDDVNAYTQSVNSYVSIMNSLHPRFSLWPTDIKVIHRDLGNVGKGGQKVVLHIVYAFQQRFHESMILRNIIPHLNDDLFFMIYRAAVQIVINMQYHNEHNNVKVAADLDKFNTLCVNFNDPHNFKLIYFDFNNPMINFGTGATQRLKRFAKLIYRKVNPLFFHLEKMSFTKGFTMEKIVNSFYFCHKNHNATLKKRMYDILYEEIEGSNLSERTKKKIRSIKISKVWFATVHGNADIYFGDSSVVGYQKG